METLGNCLACNRPKLGAKLFYCDDRHGQHSIRDSAEYTATVDIKVVLDEQFAVKLDNLPAPVRSIMFGGLRGRMRRLLELDINSMTALVRDQRAAHAEGVAEGDPPHCGYNIGT